MAVFEKLCDRRRHRRDDRQRGGHGDGDRQRRDWRIGGDDDGIGGGEEFFKLNSPPQFALRDGVPASYVSILNRGEIGYISELFVSEQFRNQGIGRTMMSRSMEVCARALHRHVFIGVDATNASAAHLYQRFGFKRIGVFSFYSKTKL